MTKLKLVSVGTSTGVVLPKELLTRLRVEKGDSLFTVETPEGFLVTPLDPAIEEQLAIGRAGMKQFRETYARLAK